MKDIQPLPREKEPEFRFNWNTPMHISPTHPDTLYLGGQFLFRSRDRGESWDRISPDLTTNDPAHQQQDKSGGLTTDNSDAERYETIFTISESPKNDRVIWAGTDDGNVQVTRDGGKNWGNVAKNVPGLPAGTWVSTIEASHHDAATAYATFDGHAAGDMKTYVYKTSDYGQSWKPLSTPQLRGFAHVVREDLVNPSLLFLGTEFGLYLSIDAGAHWAQIKGDFPSVAVRDAVIHPREGDLLIATHGRGIYILDDLTPLRSLKADMLSKEAFLLPSRPAALALPTAEQRMDGDADFTGRSLPEAAPIVYYQRKRHMFGDLKLEVRNDKGDPVTTISGDKGCGLNRVQWAQRIKPPRVPPAASLILNPFALVGPAVPEGTYTVKLIKGKDSYDGSVQLIPDPRSATSAADRAAQNKLVMQLYDFLGEMTYVVEASVDLRDKVRDRAKQAGSNRKLQAQLDALEKQLEDRRASIVAIKEGGMITGERKLREEMGELYGSVNGNVGRPTQSQVERAEVLAKRLDTATARFQSIADKEVPAANEALAKAKIEKLTVLSHDEWKKR